MAKFKPYRVSQSQLADLPIVEGQFIVTTDTQRLYFDKDNSNRIEIGADSYTGTNHIDIDENNLIGLDEETTEFFDGGSLSETTGNPLYITDAYHGVYEYKASKLSTQETTNGYQLFDIEDGTYTVGTSPSASITFKDGVMTSLTHNYSQNFGIKIPLRTSITLTANQSYTRTNNSGGAYPYITLYDSNSSSIDSMLNSDNGTKTYTPTETKEVYYIYLWFQYNLTYTQINPMMNTGSTIKTFEKYTGTKPAPNPSYPQEVKTVKGYRNLLPATITSQEANGITLTNNGNGTYNIVGTATARTIFTLNTSLDELNNGSTYTYSSNQLLPSGIGTRLEIYNNTSWVRVLTQDINSSHQSRTGVLDTTNGNILRQSIIIENGTKVNIQNLGLILNEGGTPLPYVPYGSNYIYTTVCGKNLFDKDNISLGYVKENGTLTSDNAYRTSDFIFIQPNTSYYKTLTQSPRTKYYDSNKQPLNTTTYQDISIGGSAGTFTTPNNARYLRFSFPFTGSSAVDVNSIMLNEGSTATTYEAYKENIFTIPLNNNEICGIGDYKDEIVINKNGNAKLTKRIGKVVLDGSETWYKAHETINVYVNNLSSSHNVNRKNTYSGGDLLCNNFSYFGDAQNQYFGNAVSFNNSITYLNSFYIQIDANLASSNNELKTWLSTHNTEVYYVLATPTEIDLGNINIELYDGINNISNSEDMDMNIKYYNKSIDGLYDDLINKINNTITGVSVNGTSVATSGVANITSVPASILSGAIPSGVTATTQSQGDSSTKVATTAYVDTAISNLSEPMIFKGSLGTGGTITTLPSASSSNEGWTYTVITAGTYSGQAARVGDAFVSDGTQWILIGSGHISTDLSSPNQTYYLTGVTNTVATEDAQICSTRMSNRYTGVKYQTSASEDGGALLVDDRPVTLGLYYDIS